MKQMNLRKTQLDVSAFVCFYLVLLLMSGVHEGFIVLINTYHMPTLVQIIIPTSYWALVAVLMVVFVNRRVRTLFEEPVERLSEAAAEVAAGDFSVYVAPVHTAEHADYLDRMITDFNKMVEELGSIETLKTDFFSNVSHEIKTPLALIQSSAELLTMSDLTPEQREYAEMIYQSSAELSGLITNILRLNKLERQTIVPELETYDLSAQLAECALRFEDIWERKGIDFDADIADGVYISADAELMSIVWNNLLSNAFKFTDAGGRVRLSLESAADAYIVTVADSGAGMSEETMRRIFDKFYQGDTSHSAEGNGLGLALAKRVAELMSCEISVKSTLGAGSEFRVRIPNNKE